MPDSACDLNDSRGHTMWKRLTMLLLPIVMSAVCGLLWVDSLFTVRRLPLIPFGDAALGFKSAAGWLSFHTFWLWHEARPEDAGISIPFWALISVGLALAWRAAITRRKNARFRWWDWTSFGAITLSLAFLQGRTDPVDNLLHAIRNPHDRYLTHEVYLAVHSVNRVKRGDDAAVPLIHLLEDDTPSIRERAVRALGKLDADPNLVVPALITAHANEQLRYIVTLTLVELGPIDDRIAPALILSLKDMSNAKTPVVAASALREFGPAAEAAVRALIEALDDKPLLADVLAAIGNTGPKARSAAPALIKRLKTSTCYDRLHAAQALWRIDQNVDAVVPALVESLQDPFLSVRRDAADALGEIGPPASAAIPALIAARDFMPTPKPVEQSKRQTVETSDEGLPTPREMPAEEFYSVVRAAAISTLSEIDSSE